MFTLRRPFDAHLHLRDGAMMRAVLPDSARLCAGALVMPNLVPAVTTRALAQAYAARLADATPAGSGFRAHLTAYLVDHADADELIAGFEAGDWLAAKMYPAHATTNSHAGVTDVLALTPVFRAMAEAKMVLCVHGEVTDPAVDVFDREAVFIERVLRPLLDRVPDLRVVLEHATTAAAARFVASAGDRVAMSITAHHLWWNRNAMFAGGLRPHAYCLPVLKREGDREALLAAATSGDPRVFYGSDSAPHLRSRKEMDCGCAGVYAAPTAIEAVIERFAAVGALDRLEGFLSTHGPRWYGLAPSDERITVAASPTEPPLERETPEGPVRVFLGGERLGWSASRAEP
jgi:dihydroorotase